ncbi:MAG: hypothetical protein DELT_01848 [Desulfovibrio sp.]
MSKIHPAAWIGLVINIAVAFFGLEAYSDIPALGIAMFGAVGLTVVGLVMLGMGQPAGGILGAVGSAIFVPIGLICLIGCMRTRQALIKDAKSVDMNLVENVFGETQPAPAAFKASPVQDGPAIEGGVSFALDEAVAGGSAEQPIAAAAAAPAVAARESAQSLDLQSSGVQPLADFRVKDQRVLMTVILGIGLVAFVFMGATMYVDVTSQVVLVLVVCGVQLWSQSRLLSLHALALYDDHLVCLSSQAVWAGENIVMYKLIKEASIDGNKGYITALRTDGAGTEDVKILFGAMPSDVRDEAKKAFADKMRALGVRFSQS